MRIAAIIVNYGTPELTLGAVTSLLEDSDPPEGPLDVHLVDNASPGDDAAVFARAIETRGWQGRVTLHVSSENLGFGRGNNLVLDVLRRDPPDAVFLLNPDAAVEPGALRRLAAALAADPGAGAAGASLVLPSGARQPAAFRFPTPSREVMYTLGIGTLDRALRVAPVSLPENHPGGPVDWLTGAAVLIRWRALTEAGFFDPGFFLYYEEVELMHRMGRRGWRMLSVPGARARHATGAATGVGSEGAELRRRPAYFYDSFRRYHTLTAGRRRALVMAALMLPAAVLNRGVSALARRPVRLPDGFERDHWRHVLRPLLKGRGA